MISCRNKRYLLYISQNYSYAILRPIQDVILANGGEVRWFLEGDEVSATYLSTSEVQLNSIRDIKDWNPDVVFVPGNTVPNFIPGLKVGVFHGFNAGKINRRGREDHFEIRGCFDLYCTQGPNTTKKFQELACQHGYFQVIETGWPAIDPLFTPSKESEKLRFINDDKPTVLLCSTFSRSLSCAPIIFDKIKELSKKSEWNWLIQFHPKMDKNIVEQYKSIQSDSVKFIETDNVIPLLKKADVMLCDTSSVLLMFLLQNKPVVTFRNQQPKDCFINITHEDEIEVALITALSKPKSLMDSIQSYCNEFHPYRDGISSIRVLKSVNEIIDSNVKLRKKKPLNLIRQFKLRKTLGYWWV